MLYLIQGKRQTENAVGFKGENKMNLQELIEIYKRTEKVEKVNVFDFQFWLFELENSDSE